MMPNDATRPQPKANSNMANDLGRMGCCRSKKRLLHRFPTHYRTGCSFRARTKRQGRNNGELDDSRALSILSAQPASLL